MFPVRPSATVRRYGIAVSNPTTWNGSFVSPSRAAAASENKTALGRNRAKQ
ncbi:MAG: hypothetical protein H7343_18065 [Undibacterium sp.]|nr:hypothetical protein [Opitutaceae bacterium]